MAVKNMQTVVTCSAENFGVSVIGTESGSKRTYGERQAHILSLPWRPQFGLMRNPSEPDANRASGQRTGRSGAYAGDFSSTRLARSASRAVLAKRLARVGG